MNYRDPKMSKPAVAGFARRVHRRIQALGGRSHALEDVEQELWIAWCKAVEGFDPNLGIKFTTYLHNGMRLHINRYVEKNFERFHGETIALSLDAGESCDLFGENGPLSDAVPDRTDGADVEVERESNFAFALSKLSPRAQQFLIFLKEQPREFLDEVKRLEAKAEYARSRGITCVVPQRLASSTVLDLMGASRSERAKILAEVTEMGARLSA